MPGLLEALGSWCVYNSKIIAFYRQHPNQSILCHTYKIIDHFNDFQSLLERKFNLNIHLNSALLESRYHPDELRRVSFTPELTDLFYKLHPASVDLYQQLEAVADLPLLSHEKIRQPVFDLFLLSTFVASLPLPYSSSMVRSLLSLLLSFLEADLIDNYFKKHGQYIAQLEYNYEQSLGEKYRDSYTSRDLKGQSDG